MIAPVLLVSDGPVRLVHLMAVPISFAFLAGQAGYTSARGIEIHAVSSPGRRLLEFAAREPVSAPPSTYPATLPQCGTLSRFSDSGPCCPQSAPKSFTPRCPKRGYVATSPPGWLACRFASMYINGLPHVTAKGLRQSRRRSARWPVYPERMARLSARSLAKAGVCQDEILYERRLTFYRQVRERTETWIRAARTGRRPVD